MIGPGKRLLAALVQASDVGAFRKMGLRPELFKEGAERTLYQFVSDHIIQYGVVPDVETVETTFGDKLPKVVEPPDYYKDQVTERYTHNLIRKASIDASEKLKDGHTDEAVKIFEKALSQNMQIRRQAQIIDYREAYDPVMGEYVAKYSEGDDYGISLGWPTLDRMTGGLLGGDVVSYIGRPAAGKTFKMLYSAHHMWRTHSKTVMLVSTEMKPILLMQRLAGISSQVNYSMIKKAELATVQLNKVKETLREGAERENPFYIVDGGMASSVEQIVLMAQTFRPDVVLIDGAYLIGSRTMPHLKLWERVTRVAEGVKDLLAEPLGIPAVCSYQFNREVTKSKDGAGVQHIAGADAIGQLSSLVLGLMQPDSVETLNRRKVDILKGRSGEMGEFYINWNFDKMDFSETTPKSELEFMY